MFRRIRPWIRANDLAFCHLETTLSTAPPTGYPRFNSPRALARARPCAMVARSSPLEPAPAALGRLESLDRLRAIAVLLVLGTHLGPAFHGPAPVAAVLAIWSRGGWSGVDLFFVLSGFLITTLIFEEQRSSGDVSLRNFYARRGVRLLPGLMNHALGIAPHFAARLDQSIEHRLKIEG